MKKHYETHVEDTDKLISVAGPILEYKSWYEQYRKLMEEQAQRKYGLYTPTSEGDDDFPSIPGMVARYSGAGLTNEEMSKNPVWVDKTGNGHDLQMKNFAWKEGSGISDIYPGALVFDGVDDYGTCDNFPILTKEKGYTVVALRQWDQDFLNTTLTGGLLSTRNYSTGEGVAFEKIESSNKGYWNLGAGGIIDFAKSPFTWQTSKQYNNVGILKGDKNHGKSLCVGCGLSGGQQCGRFAIWELVFLDHDATEEELTKIKDYFVKTYPWLFPDQAWTVVGKTNEDKDRATIANITSNGNDLILSNFGFAEGSGYNEQGEYAGYLVTDGVDDKILSSAFRIDKKFTVLGEWKFLNNVNVASGIVKPNSFFVYNAITGTQLYLNSTMNVKIYPTKSLKAFCSDGRVYDSNWVEYLQGKEQTIDSSVGSLNLGINGDKYAQLALKNIAIFNGKYLSKEDMIKAYIYLQTLKAK